MGLVIGLGGGNAGGGGGVVASGIIQDMEGVTWTGSAKLTDTTITEFPGADCRYCTSLYGLFYGFSNLVSVGALKNTGNVKTTSEMFKNCTKLKTVPLFDTSNVTEMNGMFSQCYLLESIPSFNTSKVTSMYVMFNTASYTLKHIPYLDTSNVTNMRSMFSSSFALQSIDGINMIKVTSDSNAGNMFYECTSLETVQISNLGVSLDLSYCKVLSVDSVLFLFNNAQSGVSGKTIQLNSLVFDQLTEEQIAIATEKGFSVTSVVRS